MSRPRTCVVGHWVRFGIARAIIVVALLLARNQSASGQETSHVAISLGEPVVVARAPVELDRAAGGWGRWQFPELSRLDDGRLLVSYSLEPDLYASSGKPVGCSYSSDDGETWQSGEPHPRSLIEQGILLPNGDRLQPVELTSVEARDVELRMPVCNFVCSYGYPRSLYRVADLPDDLRGWRFRRRAADGDEWVEEIADVTIPDELVHVTAENKRGATPGPGGSEAVTDGPLSRPCLWGRMRLADDQSLWGVTYMWRMYESRPRYSPVFLRSTDNGHTWRMAGEIRYTSNTAADPLAEHRDGFTEPDYSFRPDGSMICLMRTMDGNGHGPLFLTRSPGQGSAWSEPLPFDSFGKTPQLLSLGYGITLAAYGASGGPGFLVVRATTDPAGTRWGPPVQTGVSPVAGKAWDTCGHIELVALGPQDALMVYSDFNFPDADGIPRKTIVVRRIHVATGEPGR